MVSCSDENDAFEITRKKVTLPFLCFAGIDRRSPPEEGYIE